MAALLILVLSLFSVGCARPGTLSQDRGSKARQSRPSPASQSEDIFFLKGMLSSRTSHVGAFSEDKVPLGIRVLSNGTALSRPVQGWLRDELRQAGPLTAQRLSWGDGPRFSGRYDPGTQSLSGRVTIALRQTGTDGNKASSDLSYEFTGDLNARVESLKESGSTTSSNPWTGKITGTSAYTQKGSDGKIVRRQQKDVWVFEATRSGPWRTDSLELTATIPQLKTLEAAFWANARAPQSPVIRLGSSAVDLRANHPGSGKIDLQVSYDGRVSGSRGAPLGSSESSLGRLAMKEADQLSVAGTYDGKTRQLTGRVKLQLIYVESDAGRLTLDARCLYDGTIKARFVSPGVMKGTLTGVAVFPTKDSSGKVVKRVRKRYSWPFTATSSHPTTVAK